MDLSLPGFLLAFGMSRMVKRITLEMLELEQQAQEVINSMWMETHSLTAFMVP